MVTIGNNKGDGLIDFGYSIDYTLRSLFNFPTEDRGRRLGQTV